MGGAAGGRTGTGTVEIEILDINDNVPTLEQNEVKNWACAAQTHIHTQSERVKTAALFQLKTVSFSTILNSQSLC